MSTNLTLSFALEEFAVSGSHPELVKPVPPQYWGNVRLLAESCLQPIRDLWGKPMEVLSGYRNAALNKAVKGSATSQHCVAQAADITTDDVRGLFVLLLTEDEDFPTGQIIAYPKQNFIHIATPSERYPVPSFFVSTTKKLYTRISSLSSLNSIAPAPW
jgi:hypothetical protein